MASTPRQTNRAVTVIGLILAMAMGALEATVVSTAMPTVIGDLGGIELYAWVTTAYLLSSSVTVPIYGKLADVYGRKPVLLFGITVFLIGSAASGAATSMGALIAFRALQGLGAGAMQPIALTVVGDIFNLEERAKMQGVFGAAWGLFGMIGPGLGGLIVKTIGWRWVFYVNLPFGVAAAAILIFALHENVERKQHKLDYAGAGLLMTGLTALLLATSRAVPGIAYAALPIAGLLLTFFVVVQRKVKEPMLPLALFGRRVILIASICGAIIGGAMIATLTFVPLYVQGVLHKAPTEAGTAFTPMLIGWPVASALGGRLLQRVGFRALIRVGLGITAVAGLGLAIAGGGEIWKLQVATGAFGVGMGLSNTALLIAVQTTVGWEQRGIATASTMFFRTIGGALTVSIMGGVLNAVIAREPDVDPQLASRVLNPEALAHLPPELLATVAAALSKGVGVIFWMIGGAAVISFVVSLWFPYVPIEAKKREAVVPAH